MPLGLNLLRILNWTVGNYTPTRTFNPLTSTDQEFRNSYATLLEDLKASNLFGGPPESNAAPVFVSAPSISGTSSVGSVLTAALGTLTGTPTPTSSGQWLRGGSAISGATGTTYTIVSGDVGSALKYRQTATNLVSSVSADSNTITATAAITWILAGGTWNDAGSWDDSSTWNDGSLTYEAAQYIGRVADAGGTVTSEGRLWINSIFSAIAETGLTLNSGWLAGSDVNLSRDRLLNLVSTKPDLVPSGALHPSSVLSKGMLGLRNNGSATQGLKTADNSGFLDGSNNYNVLFFGSYAGDSLAYGTQTSPNIFTQGSSNSAGHIQLFGSSIGGLSWIDRPSSVTGMGGASGGGTATQREANIDPIAMWVEYGTTQFRTHHPEGSSEAWQNRNGDPSSNPFIIANSATPGDVGIAMILRFDGTMSGPQRASIWSSIYSAWRRIGRSALVVGNSVTATGVSDPMLSWPKQLQRWGVYNNVVLSRRAEGGRRLTAFCPTGYAQAPGSLSDPDLSVKPVNVLDWFAPNVLINDEQQNQIGFYSTRSDRWVHFLHAHNAIVSRFAAMNATGRMRAVMCTQIAWPNYPIPGSFSDTPLTYAQCVDRAFMRDASALARAATLADYQNVPTAYADWYAATNTGWPSGDDGTANDPINDVPKGDVALFADPQHPNQLGHNVGFIIHRDALIAALAL